MSGQIHHFCDLHTQRTPCSQKEGRLKRLVNISWILPEDNVPGIYRDYPLNKFGNGAVGWKKGDQLFYVVVSADKGEKTKSANWFYVEMPENADEDVVILDSHKAE